MWYFHVVYSCGLFMWSFHVVFSCGGVIPRNQKGLIELCSSQILLKGKSGEKFKFQGR